MTVEEFQEYYGMSPETAEDLLEALARIVNAEVREAIEHADFYMNPLDYCDADQLKETYGDDCLEKWDEDDGYSKLYDFKKQNTAMFTFQRLISNASRHGGYGSACAACELMNIEGWKE